MNAQIAADSRGYEAAARSREASPRARARVTGVVYLLYFLTAILAEFVGRRSMVHGVAANLIAAAFYIAVTVLFYFMFEPVNQSLSLLAAFFSLVGCAVTVLGIFHRASSYLSPLLFFGPYCLLIGYLVVRSRFLPRILGVLMMFAGLGWLIFLLPRIPNSLSRSIEVLGIVAEGLLCLWLVLAGVNVSKWDEKASAWRVSKA
jgi:hypothetical protein